MKTFNQLLTEQPHVHPVMKKSMICGECEGRGFGGGRICPVCNGHGFIQDHHDTIASLRRSAQALEELIIVKQTVLDEARVALADLREAIRKLRYIHTTNKQKGTENET